MSTFRIWKKETEEFAQLTFLVFFFVECIAFHFLQGMRQLRMHMLAAQGYCVVCIDSRGSRHRGVEFESHLFRRMGSVELADQVEILTVLATDLGFIDMDRIAIHGWSYGGYLSLMGLIQYPSIFKLAIAGAPVTNWELYDTGK